MRIYQSTLDMIGNTPLLEIRNMDTGPCQLFLKLESQNPAGSIKDRIGLRMIEAAEKQGLLKPGYTIIEATAGNTGLGLALAAQLKGYPLIIVMPDKMGKEKMVHLRAMGATIIITRSDVQRGHPQYYQDLAAQIARDTPNSFYINQFNNLANPQAHEDTTAPEIWEQLNHQLDAIVCGVGTGGTFTGLARFMEKHAPHVEFILADPQDSIIADLVNCGTEKTAGRWLIEGIGEDFVPDICELKFATQGISVSDKDAMLTGRELLRKEGILAGSSTGALLHAALVYCRKQTTKKRVVTFACDTGNKYLSKMFDDEWLWNQGLFMREKFNDLRDVIARPHYKHLAVAISPTEPIATAHKHMQTHGISQLPVLQDNKLVGMVCETDILQSIYQNQNFDKPISDVMMREFAEAPHTTSIDAIITLLNRYPAVAVMDQQEFYGLITPIDIINYFKREQLCHDEK